jgi:hypothetical protein
MLEDGVRLLESLENNGGALSFGSSQILLTDGKDRSNLVSTKGTLQRYRRRTATDLSCAAFGSIVYASGCCYYFNPLSEYKRMRENGGYV